MSALKIVLYKNKQLTNGENPIRLRVYFGKERYISLGISAKPSEWNDKTGRYSTKAPNYELYIPVYLTPLFRFHLTPLFRSFDPPKC